MLRVQLLGEFVVERNGAAVPLPVALARLLAYLAVHPGLHERDALAARFWPDSSSEAARANLRTALWALRREIGDDALVTSRRAVGLGSTAQVDVTDLRRLAADDPSAVLGRFDQELLPEGDDQWARAARDEHRRWRAT